MKKPLKNIRWISVGRRAAAGFALLLFLFPSSAPAFSKWQHELVAAIAEQNLTPAAQSQVRRLLGPTTTLASVSTWADKVRGQRRETGPWHYINFPLELSEPDFDVMNTRQGNVVWAIVTRIGILKDPQAITMERIEALEFLVHFVGDLHQPLHCGTGIDQGGNRVRVLWQGKTTSLHSVWDGKIFFIKTEEIYPWANRLQEDLSPEEKEEMAAGTPYEWMVESARIAREFAYPKLPSSSFRQGTRPPELSEDYAQAARPIFQRQILRAGLRLGRLLNSIFDPAPTGDLAEAGVKEPLAATVGD